MPQKAETRRYGRRDADVRNQTLFWGNSAIHHEVSPYLIDHFGAAWETVGLLEKAFDKI